MFFDIIANILASVVVVFAIPFHLFQWKWINSHFYSIAICNPTCVRLASIRRMNWFRWMESVNIKRKYWNSEFFQHIHFIVFFLLFFSFLRIQMQSLRYERKKLRIVKDKDKMKWNDIHMCVLCVPLPYNNIIFNLRSRANLNIWMQV